MNKYYHGTMLGKEVLQVDDTDKRVLKTLAETITKDCTTDLEKATAITKWVGRNIEYDTKASIFSDRVFYTRKGDCDGQSTLIADLCRSVGIEAAQVTGWKADLTIWTVDDLYRSEEHGFAAHAWASIYIDGKWCLFDSLFENYNISDPEEIAQLGYYCEGIDTISLVGEGIDPAMVGYYTWTDKRHLSLFNSGAVFCENELTYRVCGIKVGYRNESVYVDDDNYYMDECDAGYGDSRLVDMEKYYIHLISTDPSDNPNGIRDGYSYRDGREHPKSGYLYTDGWVDYGSLFSYYVMNDGKALNYSILTENGKIIICLLTDGRLS